MVCFCFTWTVKQKHGLDSSKPPEIPFCPFQCIYLYIYTFARTSIFFNLPFVQINKWNYYAFERYRGLTHSSNCQSWPCLSLTSFLSSVQPLIYILLSKIERALCSSDLHHYVVKITTSHTDMNYGAVLQHQMGKGLRWSLNPAGTSASITSSLPFTKSIYDF